MKQAIHYPVIRGKIRLRARLAALQQAIMAHIAPSWSEHRKLSAELDFWINAWDAKLRKGQFWNDDIKDLLLPIGEWSADAENGSIDYATIRWLEARAHGLRILKEVQIEIVSLLSVADR